MLNNNPKPKCYLLLENFSLNNKELQEQIIQWFSSNEFNTYDLFKDRHELRDYYSINEGSQKNFYIEFNLSKDAVIKLYKDKTEQSQLSEIEITVFEGLPSCTFKKVDKSAGNSDKNIIANFKLSPDQIIFPKPVNDKKARCTIL